MTEKNFDVIIFGGGTAGISAAYISAKKGLKTLLVESTDVLGGAITQGLVVPSMKVNTENINTEFFQDLKLFSDKYNARTTYKDGNEAWFNPELLKIVFDEMLKSVNCSVLFSTYPAKIQYLNKFKIELSHKILSLYIEANYIVDATSNGKIFKLLNYNFQSKNKLQQATTLRFILSNIDLEKMSEWLLHIDNDRNVTSVDNTSEQIHLSTACTWDTSRTWALYPIFKQGVENGDLKHSDTAYFQLFTIPQMPNSLAFNCPRIILEDDEDILNPFVYSKALIQGRERVYRLYNFIKNYFVGCENAFISHISDTLGVRESYRVKGKYTFTKDDIINPKHFDNIAFACDYPIDIHSTKQENDKLEFSNHTYYIPVETLICEQNEKLYAVGRIISSDFEAQAALRTQMSCFSMGEAAIKDIIKKRKLR